MSKLKFLDKEWDFTHVLVTASIDRSAAYTWSVMGDFATAGEFLNVDGKIISGDGKPGTIRQIGEGILELLAGEGLWSYTYTQIAGPMAAFTYHGSVAVRPDGDDQSVITYILSYDHTSFDPDKRISEHERLTNRFQGMVNAMKAKVELR